MQKLSINGNNKSEILIGEKLENLKNYLPNSNVIIVTDSNLFKHYSNNFPDCPIIKIGLGEKIKTLSIKN